MKQIITLILILTMTCLAFSADYIYKLYYDPPNDSPSAVECTPGAGDGDYAYVDSDGAGAPYFYVIGEWKLGATRTNQHGDYLVPRNSYVQDDEETNWVAIAQEASTNGYCLVKVSGESQPYFQVWDFTNDEFRESFEKAN